MERTRNLKKKEKLEKKEWKKLNMKVFSFWKQINKKTSLYKQESECLENKSMI